jgi:hypothetical protein
MDREIGTTTRPHDEASAAARIEHLRIGRAFGLTGACPAERVPMVRVQVHSEGLIITT